VDDGSVPPDVAQGFRRRPRLGDQYLVAVSDSGEPFIFARNRISGSEFTGVNFSPDRHTLFANIQDDGYVLAITGPFARLRRS
jgi:secreted PhoX family phosphatase